MRAWTAAVLGSGATVLIMIGYRAIERPTTLESAPQSSAPTQRNSGALGQGLSQPAPPAAQGSRRTASAVVVANSAAKPLASDARGRTDEQTTPLPAYLQKRLETDPGPGIAKFDAEMSREPRDLVWAPATEYQIQAALQELAPDLLGRMQLFQTACASSMCEMEAVLDDLDPAQASKDMTDWQRRLYEAAALDSWKATGLGPPLALEASFDPEGRPVFIVQFRKGAAKRDKSLANRARLTRASGS
jgi:hypothetical protein